MINSFIKTPKELLEYSQINNINDKGSTFYRISKTINWIFNNYAIILNDSKNHEEYVDSYRLWDQDKKLYYFKGMWEETYECLTLLDALGHIYRNDLGQYYVL